MATILIRTVIVYITILLALRLMGKRQLGQLELSELVVAFLISDLAANPLQNTNMPIHHGLLPVAVLLCCELLISALIMKSTFFRALICGKPSILVEKGVICEREMRKNRFTLDELAEELRNQGITDISKLEYAVLETDGSLNAILFPSEQAVTPSQLGIDAPFGGYTTIIINDGKLLEKNLKLMGKDKKWLDRELKRRGAKSTGDVYILTVNNAGGIYYQPKA